MLLARHKNKVLLHQIVTDDEKWIHDDYPKRRKSWGLPGNASTSTAKPNIHGKKLMLCFWRDQLGVVYYELLNPSETITGTLYRTQLMKSSRSLKEKHPQYYSRHDKIILLHDNARLYLYTDEHYHVEE
ncbi:Mariner Mos1 transposase [Eumeta japonica]|uniref:Mariner Mos1 transposase n=1 Tax=Eumeta variegata TaxID=151549 RepID=A0A4C1YL63_EUMVA|nr:Mariner Mos1 transposase [Eumeta japonica]